MRIRASAAMVVAIMTTGTLIGPVHAQPAPASRGEVVSAVGMVGATAAKAKGRTLTVRIDGLKGPRAAVRVKGPGLNKVIRRSRNFRNVRPGKYRVTSSRVTVGDTTAYPSRRKIQVRVSRNTGRLVRVSYSIRVSEQTRVVRPGTIKNVTQAPDGTYTLEAPGTWSKGDIIASPAGTQTPTGLLVKVISEKGDTIVAEQARIDEAVPQGEFDVSFVAPATEEATAASVSAAPGPKGATKPYSCSATAQAGLQAGLYGDIPVSFSAGWGGGDPYVRVRADLRAGAYAKAWAEGTVECTVTEQKVWGKTLAVITVWVGPVPIVFVPRIDTYVGAGFKATGKVSAQASVSVNGYAQLTAYRNRVVPEKQDPTFDNGFDYQGSVALNGYAYGKLRVTVDVYGVAGPNVNVTLQPEITAATNTSPWWSAGLRVKAGAGIRLDKCVRLFVKEYCVKLAQEKDDILDKYIALAQANGGLPAAPQPPAPPPPAAPPSVSFGPLTFDEYFDLGQDAEVRDLYADQGVRFEDAPYPVLSEDTGQPTWPVLAGWPRFEGPIQFLFEKDGAAAVTDRVGFDIGYLNDIGSVRIQWFDINGALLGSRLSSQLGIEHILVAEPGIHRMTVGIESAEGAGFSLDNLAAGSAATDAAVPQSLRSGPRQRLGISSDGSRP